jgi:hypothetical protein
MRSETREKGLVMHDREQIGWAAKHYFESVHTLIEELNRLTGVEWIYNETGGGCDCLEFASADNFYIITDGQASVPVDDLTGFVLGVYHHDIFSLPDPISQFETNTLEECAKKFCELTQSKTN